MLSRAVGAAASGISLRHLPLLYESQQVYVQCIWIWGPQAVDEDQIVSTCARSTHPLKRHGTSYQPLSWWLPSPTSQSCETCSKMAVLRHSNWSETEIRGIWQAAGFEMEGGVRGGR